MPDIAQKIFSNRQTYNGTAVVSADKFGGSGTGGPPNIHVLRPRNSQTTNAPNASGLAAYLDVRFDNPTYYAA